MAFMEQAKTVIVFLAIVALMGAADVAAQSSDCGNLLQGMISCIPYVAGNDPKPTGECCAALTTLVNTNSSCLCKVLDGNSGIPNLNLTKALTLPAECNVTAPPPSSCAAHAPAPSPTIPHTPAPSPTLPHTPAPSPPSPPAPSPTVPHSSAPSPTVPHTPSPPSNACAMFAPSIVAIASMAALTLMKILS